MGLLSPQAKLSLTSSANRAGGQLSKCPKSEKEDEPPHALRARQERFNPLPQAKKPLLSQF